MPRLALPNEVHNSPMDCVPPPSTTSRRSRRCTPTAGAAAIAASTPTRTSTTRRRPNVSSRGPSASHVPRPDQRTVVAMQDGELVGFVHTVLDDDPHVGCPARQPPRPRRLAAPSASGAGSWPPPRAAVVDERPGRALYLWVLERNARARRVLRGRAAAAEVERADETLPTAPRSAVLRVAWPDPTTAIPG